MNETLSVSPYKDIKDIQTEWDKRARTPGLASVMSLRWEKEEAEQATRAFIDRCFSIIGNISQSDVLEVGCGIGRITQMLNSKARKVDAIDISSLMLLRAKEKDGLTYFNQANAIALPYASNSFDLIFESTVFQHVVDEKGFEKAIAEVKRVVKPDGRIFLSGEMTNKDKVLNRSIYTKIRPIGHYLDLLEPFKPQCVDEFTCVTDKYTLILASTNY